MTRVTYARTVQPPACPPNVVLSTTAHCSSSSSPFARFVIVFPVPVLNNHNNKQCVLFFQRLVANKHDSDDGGAQASSSDDGVTSDYDVVNTSDESDENDDTRRMRELFNAEAAPDRETRMMRECRFCGKKKSKRTLLVKMPSYVVYAPI